MFALPSLLPTLMTQKDLHAMNGEKRRAPKAPPVYRPQAVAAQSKPVPPGPPVYRPLAGPAQQKAAVATGHTGAAPSRGAANVGGFPPVQRKTTLIGPPVYRPQQKRYRPNQDGRSTPGLSPAQTTSVQRTVQQKPGLIGPPVYRPQQGGASAQSKTIAASGAEGRALFAPSPTAVRQVPKLGETAMSAIVQPAVFPGVVMTPSSQFARGPSASAATAQPKPVTRFPTGTPAVLQRSFQREAAEGAG